MHPTLQPHASQAATLCIPGCNPMHPRPYYPLLNTLAVDDICAPSPPPPPPAAPPADAAPLPSSSDALGTGAIAGIVAGSVAGGALLVLLVLAAFCMASRGGRRPFESSAPPAHKAPV